MVYNIHVINKPSRKKKKKPRHFQDGVGGSISTKIGTTFNVKDIALTLFYGANIGLHVIDLQNVYHTTIR